MLQYIKNRSSVHYECIVLFFNDRMVAMGGTIKSDPRATNLLTRLRV